MSTHRGLTGGQKLTLGPQIGNKKMFYGILAPETRNLKDLMVA